MHLPPHNAELQVVVLEKFIRENPLGILTTAIRSPSLPFLQSSHILLTAGEQCGSEYGKLRGHIARQNPQAKAIIEYLLESRSTDAKLEEDVMVLFNGPASLYHPPFL